MCTGVLTCTADWVKDVGVVPYPPEASVDLICRVGVRIELLQ